MFENTNWKSVIENGEPIDDGIYLIYCIQKTNKLKHIVGAYGMKNYINGKFEELSDDMFVTHYAKVVAPKEYSVLTPKQIHDKYMPWDIPDIPQGKKI